MDYEPGDARLRVVVKILRPHIPEIQPDWPLAATVCAFLDGVVQKAYAEGFRDGSRQPRGTERR